jgi:hypothetical protein
MKITTTADDIQDKDPFLNILFQQHNYMHTYIQIWNQRWDSHHFFANQRPAHQLHLQHLLPTPPAQGAILQV